MTDLRKVSIAIFRDSRFADSRARKKKKNTGREKLTHTFVVMYVQAQMTGITS